MGFKVQKHGDCWKIRFDKEKSRKFRSTILNISDIHFDSKHCDRTLLKDTLDEALDTEAVICCYGDWFDAMQGRNDRRRDNNGKRPDYHEDCYFNAIIDESVEFLKPYAKNIAYMALGNHETAILRYTEINPMRMVASRLNDITGSQIVAGGYEGYIYLSYSWAGNTCTKKIWYTHGTGGESPRSKGVLNCDIQMAEHPDADIIISGHSHHSWILPIARERATDGGSVIEDTVLHLKIPSMKGRDGFAIEKGHRIKPRGSYWLYIEPTQGHNMRCRAMEV